MIAEEGVLPSTCRSHPNVAVTSAEEEGKGFYCAARARVPDLKFTHQRVITETLKKDWGCKPWKSGNQRGIEFPLLIELRALFDQRHGAQRWPADITEWESPQNVF
jgi:hypothetical protein